MKHRLSIMVSDKAMEGGIVNVRKVSLRERILRFMLGKKVKLTIIVPGDSVEEIDITEYEKESGNERDSKI